MEVKKPVGSRRRQLALKVMTPICGGGDVASREDNSTSWRHTRPPVGEDVDAQQRRHNKPAVQAETPVGGEVANVGTKSSINNNEDTSRRRRRRSTVKEKMPTNVGIIGQPCRQRHQSAAAKASRCGPSDIRRFAETTAASWPIIFDVSPKQPLLRGLRGGPSDIRRFAETTAASWNMIFDVSPKQPRLRGLCCGPSDIRHFVETTAASMPMLWTLRYSTFRRNNRCFVAYVVDPQIFDVSPKQPLLRGLCCGLSDIRRFAESTTASWPMLWTLRYSTFCRNNRCFVASEFSICIPRCRARQPTLMVRFVNALDTDIV
uniref:Uncharacterized protein n=1 Tax=Oryza sativa subsp. japonica TaxID=39947 RepID=Q2QLV0_ORYSJ|nr:hypothetical protein LOC_Os12g43220 [Oryza sativa Japonica Group]